MQELVRFLVASLVDHPEDIELYEAQGGRTTVLELKVHPDDVGKVIGRQGKTANALRTLVKAHASKIQTRVVLEIIEAGDHGSEADEDEDGDDEE